MPHCNVLVILFMNRLDHFYGWYLNVYINVICSSYFMPQMQSDRVWLLNKFHWNQCELLWPYLLPWTVIIYVNILSNEKCTADDAVSMYELIHLVCSTCGPENHCMYIDQLGTMSAADGNWYRHDIGSVCIDEA